MNSPTPEERMHASRDMLNQTLRVLYRAAQEAPTESDLLETLAETVSACADRAMTEPKQIGYVVGPCSMMLAALAAAKRLTSQLPWAVQRNEALRIYNDRGMEMLSILSKADPAGGSIHIAIDMGRQP